MTVRNGQADFIWIGILWWTDVWFNWKEYVIKSSPGIRVVQEQVKPYVLSGCDSEEGSRF